MPAAARTGDPTNHGGVIAMPPPGPAAQAVARVLIGGRPAAVATTVVSGVGSVITCPIPQHAALGPTNVIKPDPTALAKGQVLIGGLPAARARDRTTCGAMIVNGAPNVLIGGV
ncbi:MULTISPECIES: PAAR domain-containing protein [Streptomyces]|uniref:PAAR domain-containing protein n=1 Tax=Streptomyces TaxID=1883 RepID=UPI00148A0AE2|nr:MULTISPECIES: PAAR domain-containing protein [Streptomyces]